MIDSGLNTFFQILIGAIFTCMNMFGIATAAAEQQNAAKGKMTMGQGIIEEDEEGSKPTSPENEDAAFFPVTFQTMFY